MCTVYLIVYNLCDLHDTFTVTLRIIIKIENDLTRVDAESIVSAYSVDFQ